MCKFESAQSEKSRAQSADSSKAYSKSTAFDLGSSVSISRKLAGNL